MSNHLSPHEIAADLAMQADRADNWADLQTVGELIKQGTPVTDPGRRRDQYIDPMIEERFDHFVRVGHNENCDGYILDHFETLRQLKAEEERTKPTGPVPVYRRCTDCHPPRPVEVEEPKGRRDRTGERT